MDKEKMLVEYFEYRCALLLILKNSETILWIVELAPKLRIESILLAVFDQELPAAAGCPRVPTPGQQRSPTHGFFVLIFHHYCVRHCPYYSLFRPRRVVILILCRHQCGQCPGHQWTSAPWSPRLRDSIQSHKNYKYYSLNVV